MPKKTRRQKIAAVKHRSSDTLPAEPQRFIDATQRVIEIAPQVQPRLPRHQEALPISNIRLIQRDILKSFVLVGLLLCIEYILFLRQNQYHDILNQFVSIFSR